MMSCLMSDLIEGTVTPSIANATVKAGANLLKVVELQLKYGRPKSDGTREKLELLDRERE